MCVCVCVCVCVLFDKFLYTSYIIQTYMSMYMKL